jgi:ABC-type antimicrobial peptide transport system permease subunit
MAENHERQIHLPFSEAFKIALRSLRIRFWRAIITMMGITLTIAFLASVLKSSAITTNLTIVTDEIHAQRLWVVVMSLLVCVVGITNSMLMAVTERFKEIGTMKCLGALDKFVVELFLLESSLQGFFGSLIGSIAGTLLMVLIQFSKEGKKVFSSLTFFRHFSINDIGCIIVLCVAVGVGLSVLGAIYPAYTASKMVPADAMRVEM